MKELLTALFIIGLLVLGFAVVTGQPVAGIFDALWSAFAWIVSPK